MEYIKADAAFNFRDLYKIFVDKAFQTQTADMRN